MDQHQAKHKQISVILALTGSLLTLILAAIMIGGAIYVYNKVRDFQNQSLISKQEIVKFNLEKAAEVAH